jgi:hypothetical protein
MNLLRALPILAVAFSTVAANAQSCAEPPPGLVAWWPGDGNFKDIQGNNPGTNAGGTTFILSGRGRNSFGRR